MIIKLPFLPWDLNIQRHARNKAAPPPQPPLPPPPPPQPLPQPLPPQTIIKRDNYNKIFCIGANKTGTTSLEKLFSLFGFELGNQAAAEVLSLDWLINKNAERIIKYCYTADAFQDVPFSYPGIFKELDKAFPNSKFILTVRNSPDEWFKSLVRFHTNVFSSDPTRPPNVDELTNATYRYKGYAFEIMALLYGYPKTSLYDESAYKNHYVTDNDEKRTYFKDRPNDFIEINLAVKEDFWRLCDFLGVETNINDFPWLNRSE